MTAILGALRVIGGGLFFPVVVFVGGPRDESGVAEGLGVDLSWRALKFRFLRIGMTGVAMTAKLQPRGDEKIQESRERCLGYIPGRFRSLENGEGRERMWN